MARYRLLTPHCLQQKIGSRIEAVFIDKGTEISDTDFAAFAATPGMVGLNAEAEAAVLAVCNAAREHAESGFTGQYSSSVDIPGFGNSHTLPGGDLYGLPQTDP